MLKSCQVVPLCQVTSIFSKTSPAHFAGGPVSNIVDTYLEQKKKRLSDPEQQNVCDTVNYSVHVSLVSDLTLEEYIVAR